MADLGAILSRPAPHDEATLGHLGTSWSPLGPILGPSWAPLGRSSGHLRRLESHVGPSSGHLKAILSYPAPHDRNMTETRTKTYRKTTLPGHLVTVLELSCAILGPAWAILGPP